MKPCNPFTNFDSLVEEYYPFGKDIIPQIGETYKDIKGRKYAVIEVRNDFVRLKEIHLFGDDYYFTKDVDLKSCLKCNSDKYQKVEPKNYLLKLFNLIGRSL